MKTVIKFFRNDNPTKGNIICSATLGKIAVPDRIWLDDNQHRIKELENAFWLVDVTKETEPGQPRGCFITTPIKPLTKNPPEDWPQKLTPGFFIRSFFNGMQIVTVNADHRDYFWIVPLSLKRKWRQENPETYAIVVDLYGTGIDFLDAYSVIPPTKRFGNILPKSPTPPVPPPVSRPNNSPPPDPE